MAGLAANQRKTWVHAHKNPERELSAGNTSGRSTFAKLTARNRRLQHEMAAGAKGTGQRKGTIANK